MTSAPDAATVTFVSHRDLLFTVAYEMLGSAADAEDVLQETWLRWANVEMREVQEPRAFMIRIVTRLALNRIRSVKRRREDYVGPWLPEPLATAPDASEAAELAEQVSMALLVVLETLAPLERAVFVLRDAFGVPYEQIAASVEKSPDAVRQIAHRARRRVAAGRPRRAASPAELKALLQQFKQALEARSIEQLLDVLSPDVVLLSDGGGVAPAALAPIVGAPRLAKLFTGGLTRLQEAWSCEFATINGEPALLMRLNGRLDGVMAAKADSGRIAGLYYVRNPAKLGRVESPTLLALTC